MDSSCLQNPQDSDCVSCNKIKRMQSYHKKVLNLIKCKHEDEICCCSMLKDNGKRPEKHGNDANKVQLDTTVKGIEDLFVQYDEKSGIIQYFCEICHKYDPKRGSPYNIWTSKGVPHNSNQNRMIKLHLSTDKHLISVRESKKNQQQEKYHKTCLYFENMLRVTQYLITSEIPMSSFESYSDFLCSFKAFYSNLLGPQGLTNIEFENAAVSNYIAGQQQKKKEMELMNKRTKQKWRISISIRKITAPFDTTRQVLVGNYVKDGSFKEVLVSAARILDTGIEGTVRHVTENCSKLVETSNIVSVYRDEFNTYNKNNKKLIVSDKFCNSTYFLIHKIINYIFL